MHRLFLGVILAVLVVLLAVMSWAVSPRSPEQPEPPKKTAAQMNLDREEAIKREAETMKKSAQGIPQPMPLQSYAKPDPPSANKVESVGAPSISRQWTKKRKPGEEGLKEVQVEASKRRMDPPQFATPATAK